MFIIYIIHEANVNILSFLVHDVQFTIGNDTLQEVVSHNEKLGENDEVSCFTVII